ncbi:MAG: hypothetical protein PHQ11_00555 [Paludibacter sp.]|nr:hypothetical protein [Paludibacter sp.]
MKRGLLLFFSIFTILLHSFTVYAIGQGVPAENSTGISVATFDMDVTPPIGYKMAYGTMINSYDLSLRAKGLVLLGAGQPIVLVSFDWIGIKMNVWMRSKKHLLMLPVQHLNVWQFILYIHMIHLMAVV